MQAWRSPHVGHFKRAFSALMMIALLPAKFSPASKQELLKLSSLSKTTCAAPSWFGYLPLTVSPQRKQWQARSQICNPYRTFSPSSASFWGSVKLSCYREALLRINLTIRMADNLNTISSKYWLSSTSNLFKPHKNVFANKSFFSFCFPTNTIKSFPPKIPYCFVNMLILFPYYLSNVEIHLSIGVKKIKAQTLLNINI